MSNHATITTDEILQQFGTLRRIWETMQISLLKKMVVQHFSKNHYHTDEGRFVVPLPRKPQAKVLGVSQSQAVRWFLALEWSLHAKGNFDTVIQEYFHLGHAEKVPVARACGANVPPTMHVVRKESSTTAKVIAVFDASAKCSTGVSLNDILLVARFILPWLTYSFSFSLNHSYRWC